MEGMEEEGMVGNSREGKKGSKRKDVRGMEGMEEERMVGNSRGERRGVKGRT